MEITLQKLKNDARQINASIRIGKSGITEGILAELNKKLKDIKLVKIKLLRAALEEIDKKKVGDELAEKTRSMHVQTIGNCVILYKR